MSSFVTKNYWSLCSEILPCRFSLVILLQEFVNVANYNNVLFHVFTGILIFCMFLTSFIPLPCCIIHNLFC